MDTEIKKGSYINILLNTKDTKLEKKMFISFDCMVKDLCVLFFEFEFDKGEVVFDLLETSDGNLGKSNWNVFYDIKAFPNFKYVLESIQNRRMGLEA